MSEMSDATYNQIDSLINRGRDFADRDRYAEAIECYRQALGLIPPPAEELELFPYIMTLLGDACYSMGNYAQAEKWLLRALMYDYHTNPMTVLRTGQVAFELGKREAASQFLINAYMLKGKGIFNHNDPKYWEFVKDRIPKPSFPLFRRKSTDEDLMKAAVKYISDNAPVLAEKGWLP